MMFLLNLITDENIIKHTFECIGINQIWFSILKNGFYINPTTVGVKINGKAYGNGIYFSDSLIFSFSYCNMNNYDKSGFAILGLCEVVLCDKSVSNSPIFVIFNTNQYTFRYLLVVQNK